MSIVTRARFIVFFALSATAFLSGACSKHPNAELTPTERAGIADSLKRMVIAAYDLSNPDVVASMMSLYPPSGRVISASGGAMTTTRSQLENQIKAFWKFVGSNMKQPKWSWTAMEIDVLSRDVAVMTSTYEIPHTTPSGMRHVIGGAWTAVFARRNGRWMIVQEHLSDAPQKMGM